MATDYGKRLRIARKSAGFTQAALSKKTGISQSTISTAEREGAGSSETPVYADACGVDSLWLATGKGEMVPASPQSGGVTPLYAGGTNQAPARMDTAHSAELDKGAVVRSVKTLGEKMKNASPGRQAAILSLMADYGKDPDRIAKEIDMLLGQDDTPTT